MGDPQMVRDLHSLIDVLLGSDKIHGLMVLGEAGIGKTYNVLKYLEERDVIYSLMKTYSTPLSLYKYLYQHRNDRLIVMDDVDGIWENPHSAAILKRALWEDDMQRTIEWHSTTKNLGEVPTSFEFNAKIIFICNKTRDNPHINAVLSRILHYKFAYTREELLDIMREICKQKTGFALDQYEKREVVDFIEKNASIFDFRTMIQGFAIREQSKFNKNIDWKSTFLSILQGDANRELKYIYDLSKSDMPVEEQCNDFCKKFGKSRRTFFYYRAKLRDSGCL